MKVSPTTVWASPEKQSLALGNHSGQEENNISKQIHNGSEIGMTSYPGARGYQQVQFPQQYLPSEANSHWKPSLMTEKVTNETVKVKKRSRMK